MSLENKTDQQKCQSMLKLPEIRFVGFLDYMGNLIVGDFKPGVNPLKNEEERKKMFVEAVLRIRTRQDFDENLGSVKYAAARRAKVVTLTFLACFLAHPQIKTATFKRCFRITYNLTRFDYIII